MRFFCFLIFLLFVNILLAQSPILVKDINPGPLPSASLNFPHIQINDVIYFVGNIQGKRDLYAVKDGEVQALSTMCPSNCAAFQFFYFEFQGKLFFIKQIDSKINQLWESDGSIAGTKLVFEYPGLFKSAVVGSNNKIYLGIGNRNTFKDEVFISDGTTSGTKKLATDLKFGGENEAFGLPIKYKNGVAFGNIKNDTLILNAFDQENLSILSKSLINKGSTINGLKSINSDNIIILVHSDDSSSSDVYKFYADKKEIVKELNLPFERQKYPHLKDFGKDTLMLFHKAGGNFFLTGSSELSLINITPFSNPNIFIENYYYTNNLKASYHTADNSSSSLKYRLVLIDKKVTEIKLFDLDLPPSDIIGYNDYAFSITQSPAGTRGKITMYFLSDKTSKQILNINQTFSTNGIKPLGLIGSKLYFLANLNESFGKELYYVETGIPTSTKEDFSVIQNPFTIEVRSNLYKVKSESNHTVNLEFLDTSGRLLHTRVIDTNQEYHFDENLRGLVFMKVTDLKSSKSKSTSIYIN